MLWMGIWVHHYSHITCAGGGDFRENGVWPSQYDVAVSWLRLQTPINCVPHPYWLYTKYFSTLRYCGWAYGCILNPYAVIHLQVGVSLRKNGVWLSPYDVGVSLLRLRNPIDCIQHPYRIYTKCFSTWRCCRWAYGYTLMPYHYMCRWG